VSRRRGAAGARALIDAREFIREKRERRAHAPAAMSAFIDAYMRDEVRDYQVSAWLMAAFLNGLDAEETDALTAALIGSGRMFDWTALGRPSADKHSTGGVGDKISLILAPLVAACGVLVPMVSGRGLGHTGGTLDKLESIPGFRTHLAPDAMRAQLDTLGVVMVGQGPDLAPADGRLYALRDVTSTVEFEPFIVSSIVSKKVAEGAMGIAYDVKVGNGAFMRTPDAAVRLARRLVDTTRALGRRATALVTDMSQPLGEACGNALEVRESVEVLSGRGPADVRSLTLELAAEMLCVAGAEREVGAARARATHALDSGAAMEKFVALVRAQGGDAQRIERADGLPKAPVVTLCRAARAGVIAAIDTFALGDLVVEIGGGRRSKEDTVDPRVGLMVRARIGDRVAAGDTVAELHLATADEAARARIERSFEIGDTGAAPALVLERIGEP
jgi:pyrimidine-nucleoside phosphorylase